MAITMNRIMADVKAMFDSYLTEEDFELFEQCHKADEFVAIDPQTGHEFVSRDYLRGYVESWAATRLEDAGYWEDEELAP